jgi:hypothetical protein
MQRKRRLPAAALMLLLALAQPARAGEPLAVDPARQGYVFEDPRILVRQIIFGLAHGVTLLARACLDVGDELRRPTQAAYEEWLMRYGERIVDSEQVLAAHYFGARAAEANEEDIARALNLPPKLDLLRTPGRLREACETFPAALARKRYNLDLVHAVHRDQLRLGRALEIRASLAQCRQSAAAEKLPAIDAALAAWETENAAVEKSARTRWLKFIGDDAALRAWETSVAGEVRQRLTAGAADLDTRCDQVLAGLATPAARLATLLGDGPQTPPTAEAEAAAEAETAPARPGS